MTTAYLAALPRELASLTRGLTTEPGLLARGIFLYRRSDAVFACAGMGQARVALAAEAAFAAAAVNRLVSVGVVGACSPALHVGALLRPSVVVDTRTGERFAAEQGDGSTLITAAAVAAPAEKARLFAGYNAQCVDMEAAQVARMALQRGVAFAAIKAVSDEADFVLPDPSRFVTAQGQFAEARFAFFAALRPWLWPTVLRLARGSKLAIAGLAQALEEELSTKA